MDAAFDLKKAAEHADELKVDATKYCHWGRPRNDASELGEAIARFLLNHESLVPRHVAASKMWHVSFVAQNLIRELDSIGSFCASKSKYDQQASDLFRDYRTSASRFRSALTEFEQLAALQTLWQEKENLQVLTLAERDGQDHTRSELQSVARNMKESQDAASQVSSRESRRRANCYGR